MQTIPIGSSTLETSRLLYGCMRISADPEQGRKAVVAAYDAGYTHFDHADIYGDGACESLFGRVLGDCPGMRDQVVITSKCGICPAGSSGHSAKQYNLDREHILASVDRSLERLACGHLDVLLLHRPDPLYRPEEAAAAFDQLKAAGKVRWFGVSNFSASQVSVLQRYCSGPLVVNQVEINIHRVDALYNGVLDQCLERTMTPQAWCPLGGAAYPAWGNTFDPETERRIRTELDRQAAVYGVPGWVVMLAWILRLPAGICPIIGSTRPERIREAPQALELDYQRDDWYRLLEARNGRPVP